MNKNFPANNKPVILYRYEMSGHCHRVELMMSLMCLPFDTVNLERDDSNKPDWFEEISPMGQVPVIDDNGYKLADSIGIIIYLLKKYGADTTWLVDEPEQAGKIQRWLSIAAGELVAGPAIARFSKVFKVDLDYETAKKKSISLFTMMEKTLSKSKFLTGNNINVSDITLYTYVAHAPEGGLELNSYPNIVNWLKQIETLEHFVPMKTSPLQD